MEKLDFKLIADQDQITKVLTRQNLDSGKLALYDNSGIHFIRIVFQGSYEIRTSAKIVTFEQIRSMVKSKKYALVKLDDKPTEEKQKARKYDVYFIQLENNGRAQYHVRFEREFPELNLGSGCFITICSQMIVIIADPAVAMQSEIWRIAAAEFETTVEKEMNGLRSKIERMFKSKIENFKGSVKNVPYADNHLDKVLSINAAEEIINGLDLSDLRS